jgi:hypothetical protein
MSIYTKVIPVDPNKHKAFSVINTGTYAFSKEMMSVPLTLSEYFAACKSYPIFFSKDKHGKWFSQALLGVGKKSNSFLDKDNSWKAPHYIPAFLRRYPFTLIQGQNENELKVGIDEATLSDVKKGEHLFTATGNQSDYLTKKIELLQRFKIDAERTAAFIDELDQLKVLEEKANGLYVINPEKLNKITKKAKERLYTSDKQHYITAHLISLSNVNRVASMS